MKLSKKSRYGLRALIDLAVHTKTHPVTLSSIAERNGISLQYLEQVFAGLRRAGIIKSIKGPQGGYLLAREAAQITAADILEALEGDYLAADEEMPEDNSYARSSVVVQELIIDRVNAELEMLLKDISLSELEQSFLSRQEYGENMYYI